MSDFADDDGGSIADDTIDGTQCSWCGTLFKEPHGHPVACKDCYDDDPSGAERCGLSRAYNAEIGEDEDDE